MGARAGGSGEKVIGRFGWFRWFAWLVATVLLPWGVGASSSPGFPASGPPGLPSAQPPHLSPVGSPGLYECEIVRTYPHDAEAFTQGLLFDGRHLYESTGLRGKSSIRRVDLRTGKVLESRLLPLPYFGEGLVQWQDRLIQFTWTSRKAIVYDKKDLTPIGELPYPHEGWGITSDGTFLVASDGTHILRFLDPLSLESLRELPVTDGETPVPSLNELEYVRGEIFANVWMKDVVARISPHTGEVLGWVDLSSLRAALGNAPRAEALNGIAYDASADRLFVTGKCWPLLFEIRIRPR